MENRTGHSILWNMAMHHGQPSPSAGELDSQECEGAWDSNVPEALIRSAALMLQSPLQPAVDPAAQV